MQNVHQNRERKQQIHNVVTEENDERNKKKHVRGKMYKMCLQSKRPPQPSQQCVCIYKDHEHCAINSS